MRKKHTPASTGFLLKSLQILLPTCICTFLVYLLCSHFIVPQYKANAIVRVGYLSEEYLEAMIQGRPLNLTDELKEYISSDETFQLAAETAHTTPEILRSVISVSGENGNEDLLITAYGTNAGEVKLQANAYAAALCEILQDSILPITGNVKDDQILSDSIKILQNASLQDELSSKIKKLITFLSAIFFVILFFFLFSKLPFFDSVGIILFSSFIILCGFPLYYLLINTISDSKAIADGKIVFFPQGLHFKNYISIFSDSRLNIVQGFIVTLLRTVIGTLLMVLVSGWAGYLLTKKKMWKYNLWYRIFILSIFIDVGLIPWMMNMEMLELKNNFLAYILPYAVVPINIIITKSFIETIPRSLEEAACIDGANTPCLFFRIILPLSMPILSIIAIIGAANHWNSLLDSLLLMPDAHELQTIQHRLYSYQQAIVQGQPGTGKAHLFTASIISVLPLFLIYPFAKRCFNHDIMLGAVKG